MPARMPDFLGIGTQKGGTTSLHRWLSKQPEVFLPDQKELHYFDLNFDRSINWYKNYFTKAKFNQTCGEITPFYLFHPKVPKRIYEILPNARLIILLRDPVERTISHYWHARKRGFETLSPEKAIEAEEKRLREGGIYSLQKHSYIGRSRYIEQLDRYEKYFKKEQLLILKSENLFTNSKETQNEIKKFLMIEDEGKNYAIEMANKRSGEYEDIPTLLREKLQLELKETILEIKKRYGFGWDWQKREK